MDHGIVIGGVIALLLVGLFTVLKRKPAPAGQDVWTSPEYLRQAASPYPALSIVGEEYDAAV